jgi:hypothetical protein
LKLIFLVKIFIARNAPRVFVKYCSAWLSQRKNLIVQCKSRFFVSEVNLICILSHIHDQVSLSSILVVTNRKKLAGVVLELVDNCIRVTKWLDMPGAREAANKTFMEVRV